MDSETYADQFASNVAAELRAERVRRMVTIASIVDETGLSKSAVLNYLNGKREIPIPAFAKLCRALGVDGRVIFGRVEESLKQD